MHAPPLRAAAARWGGAFGAVTLPFARRAAHCGRAGDVGRLPLHLCAMAVYICVLHAVRGGALTGQFLYAFCMPGAAFALFFPDWRCYPALSFMTLAGFMGHTLIVAYVLMQVCAGDIVPDIRRAPACLGVMLRSPRPCMCSIYSRARITHVPQLAPRPAPRWSFSPSLAVRAISRVLPAAGRGVGGDIRAPSRREGRAAEYAAPGYKSAD